MEKIRELIEKKDYPAAVLMALAKAKVGTNPNTLMALSRVLDTIPNEVFKEQGFTHKKIAILAGYTTPFIAALTKVFLFSKKVRAQLFESEYGLYEQAIYSADPALVAFKPDLCYFCVGTDHLGAGTVEAEIGRWQALWLKANELLGCDVVLNTFEEPLHRVFGNFEAKRPASRTNFVRQLNAALALAAPAYLHFNDVNAQAALHGRRNWRDEKFYDVSKVPVSLTHLNDYAENLAAVCASVFGRSKKCLVLDLDNTLWGGVIGDDGVAGIKIGEDSGPGEGFKRFQTYIKQLKERGIILAVCSKNNEELARQPFTSRTDMVLRLDDISCFVANWEPKPENIKLIAKTLNIGLDSLVFVDDNPAEREIVSQTLRDVAVLEMPDDPAEYTAALSQAGYFEVVAVTEEDLGRTEQYKTNAQREELLAQTTDYPQFLKGLKMTAVLKPFDDDNLPRITQLINKTNQFNVTTRRYGESDVRQLAQDPKALTRYLKLIDKFGDNGLISVFIGKFEGSALVVDTWLMSCRVLKRGVEDLLFRELVQHAQSRGARWIKGQYLPTAKNAMVAHLFRDFGFVLESENAAGETAWSFDLGDQARVRAALDKAIYIETLN